MTIYTDNFNRADANPLDGSWAKPTGVSLDFALSSNAAGGTGADGSRFAYNTNTVGNKQFSQAACSTISDGDVGVACRIQTGSFSGYSFANRTVANGGWILERYDSGTITPLASNAASGGAANDVIRIEANGSTITAYVNGSVALTAADTTYASGRVGMWCFNTTSRLDNWSGGDLGSVVPAAMHHRRQQGMS